MRTIRRHFTALLVTLALASLALGTEGFRSCDATCTLATALYRSMQLFYWNYFPWNTTAEATLPWSLELARWLAPLATLGALSQVAMALFQRRWDSFRARRLRGHIVICGAGEKGATLAKDLARGGERSVVLVEQDEARAEALAATGALVIHGDATRPEVLRLASAQHAAKVVVTTGDDHDNLTIAMTAAHLGGRSGELSIHAHSRSSSLCDLYQRNRAMSASLNGSVSIRVFNHSRNVARSTILDFPPEAATGEAHIILPSLSLFGNALAVEYALVGHFTDGRRIHLSVVGAGMSHELASLRSRYPSIEHCASIKAIDLDASDTFPNRVATLINSSPASARFTVFPDFGASHHAFAHALELIELTRSRSTVRVLLHGESESPLRTLVSANPELKERIGFLPTPASACGYEAVIGEALDRTARKIHEKWLEETRSQIEAARSTGDESRARRHEAKATFKPWDQLNEEQKGASRSQADHIPFKIRAAGLDPKTVTPADWAQLSAEQIEVLARMEHARWAAYYWMTGWTFAALRDDERKQHPDLVAYDDLDEPTKEYDRAAVRNLAAYLGR